MSNIKRIDDFLKLWVKIIEQNPHISTEIESLHEQVYTTLIRYDVKEKDKIISLSNDINNNPKHESTFEHWIHYYEKEYKITVFNSTNWSYFCQFISNDQKSYNANEHIKIYIPLDSDHIKVGAKLIFDFLIENDISHNSKIGKQIRFDDIFIRLIDEKDAQKLLTFIKNNSYIQEGLIKPNPFAFQQNGIAMACDGSASYNETVAYMIAMYLADCKKKNTLHEVNYKNFYHFIANNYKNEFITHSDNPFQKALKYKDENEKENYQHIIALILNCQNPEFNLEDYFKHYHHSVESKKPKNKNNLEDKSIHLLLNAINIMAKKYGIDKGIELVEAYILTGNCRYLTRDENLREIIVNSNLRKEILTILKEKNISFKDYIKQIYLKQDKQSTINNQTELLLNIPKNESKFI